MIKELYRLRLIIFLAFVAVFLGLVRFRYRNYQWPEPTTPAATQLGGQATPTVMPTPIPEIKTEVIYPLIDLLPYKGKDFVVDSYNAPLTLSVITTGNIKTVTKEVNKWMIKNKVATESHKLIFSEK